MISPTELVAFVNAMYAQADASLMQNGLPRPNRVYVTKRYSANFAGLVAGGAAQQQQIQISANGDFILTRINYRANIANAAQTVSTLVVPQLLMQLTDSGSDELFANQALDINAFASLSSSANKDEDEMYPRVISGRSTLTISLQNTEAANTYNVEVTLLGILVKTWGGNA